MAREENVDVLIIGAGASGGDDFANFRGARWHNENVEIAK